MQEVQAILAVLALVGVLLFVSAVVRRYQAHKAQLRARVKRELRAARSVETLLQSLHGLSVGRDIRVALRRDLLIRYRHIRGLVPRHPHIDEQIQRAESAANAEGSPSGKVGPVDNPADLRVLLQAADELNDWLLGAGRHFAQAEQLRAWQEEVGERRAEANAHYHMVAANRRREAGDEVRAHQHLTTLMQMLRQRGPNTEFVRQLYDEAEKMLHAPSRAKAAAQAAAEEEKPA